MSRLSPSADTCDFCGLPLPGGGLKAAEQPLYCCYGCRFAAEVTRQRGAQGQANVALVRLGLAIFCTMNVGMFTMVLWADDMYPAAMASGGELSAALSGLLRHLCLLASLPVAFLLGLPLARSAWEELRRGRITSDLLLASGVIAAFAYSAASVFRGAGQVYFEVGCVILVAVTLGRWLEATGRLRASDELDRLTQLLPERVRLVVGDRRSLATREINLTEVALGDRLRILPGERFACDGRLIGAAVAVDQQILTGESAPVVKEAGDEIWGGTINLDGDVAVEVTKLPTNGVLARLIEAVRDARAIKGHWERLADRVAAVFTPAVLVIAVAAGGFHAWQRGFEQGLMTLLAVVLIACPCALGLATPMAVWTAMGRAARARVLFRDGEALERLAGVRAVCFDKTGTLTTGVNELAGCWVDPQSPRPAVLAQAARLASHSPHPLSLALADALDSAEAPDGIGCVRVEAGRGISAVDRAAPDRGRVVLGSPRWLKRAEWVWPAELETAHATALAAGFPVCAIGWNGRVRGLFAFRETLRDSVAETLAKCRERSLQVEVLTGDHAVRGAALEQALGVTVRAELLPEQKLEHVRSLHASAGAVAMVGDGVNDAPALAGSDVGVSLAQAADLARDQGDVCLLDNNLSRLPWAIGLAQQTVRVIRQNLFWAFAYNSVGVVLAATGRLNPVIASVLMVASSALVAGNALRIGRELPEESHSPASAQAAEGEPHAGSDSLDTTRTNS